PARISRPSRRSGFRRLHGSEQLRRLAGSRAATSAERLGRNRLSERAPQRRRLHRLFPSAAGLKRAQGTQGDNQFCRRGDKGYLAKLNALKRQIQKIKIAALPHYHVWNIHLRRPDQSDNPSDECPSKEQVEQKDCHRVPLAVGESDDGRQKIKKKSKAQKWRKQEREKESEYMHICLRGHSCPHRSQPGERYARSKPAVPGNSGSFHRGACRLSC